MSPMLTASDIADFRNRLCAAAADLFAEKGFEAFTMRELARRLGTSAMTPYRYFKDKEAIVSEVRARAFARFADWLENHLAAPDAGEMALSQACVQYAVQEPSQYRLMFAFVQPASSMQSPQVAQESRLRNILAVYLRALARRHHLNGDPEHLGIILWPLLYGTAALYVAGKLSSEELGRALSDAMFFFASPPAETRQAAPVYGNGRALL